MKAKKTICVIGFGSRSDGSSVPSTISSALFNKWVELAEAVEQRVTLGEKESLIWALYLWGEGTDEKPFYCLAQVNRSERGYGLYGLNLLQGSDCSGTLISRAYYPNIDIFIDGFGFKGSRGKVTAEVLAEEIAKYLNQPKQ